VSRGDYGTAEVLVGHGCDSEGWAPVERGSRVEETLLHRAIEGENQKAAVFLIKNGCNVNALKRLRSDLNESFKEPSKPKEEVSCSL